MSWTYVKEKNDVKYRVVDLYHWDNAKEMRTFSTTGLPSLSPSMLVETEDEEGNRTIRYESDVEPVTVNWHFYEGGLRIIFPKNTVAESGVCVSHLFLEYDGFEGMKYHLPEPYNREESKVSGCYTYDVCLGGSIGADKICLKGDAYFNCLFDLQMM